MFVGQRGGNIDHAGAVGGQRDADPVAWAELQFAFAVERDGAARSSPTWRVTSGAGPRSR